MATEAAVEFPPGSSRGSGQQEFVLLNDRPVEESADDLLGMAQTAGGIASMLVASRGASPFVLAIDAGWGMGKSTLLHQVQSRLAALGAHRGDSKLATVWFNAWTAEGSDALEGLIKSVLEELDTSVLRRWARKVARRRRLLGMAWIGLGVIARFFGVARLVDELWKQLSIDARARNQLRVDISGMLKEWVNHDGQGEPGQCMVVFIDDLDRCSDSVVVQVCEAIKLYLDAPGLIFVLACDQSVLARGVSASARGGAEEGRSYLEKIVQVVYRIPPPDEAELMALIAGYAKQSRTQAIIDSTVEKILVAGTGRNPRKIKRIINSFILEYQLDPAWHEPPLSGELLVIAVLLQHLYPPFYDLIVRDTVRDDPIDDFVRYARLRRELVLDVAIGEQQGQIGEILEKEFNQYHLGGLNLSDRGEVALKRLEQKLPEEFSALAGRAALIALLGGLDDKQARIALTTRLINRPLLTEKILFEPETAHRPGDTVRRLQGLRVMWVDDNPDGNTGFASTLEDMGAEVKAFTDTEAAVRNISRDRPNVVISDITRGDDPDAGFTGAAALRTAGYTGPLVFYTARITPERRRRAEEVGALGVVTNTTDVLRILSEIGDRSRSQKSVAF